MDHFTFIVMPILLLLALLIPLAFSPLSLPFGFMDAFEIKRTILELGAMALLGAGAIRLGELRGSSPGPAVLAAVLYVAYCAIHSLFVHPGRIPSRDFFETFCLLIVFLAAVRAGREEKNSLILFGALSAAGFFASVWGLAQALQGTEPYSTLGNRNFFATFAMCAVTVSVFLARRGVGEKRIAHAVFHGLAAMVCLAALAVCKSKAAWLGLAFGGAALLGMRRKWTPLAALLAGGSLFFCFGPTEGIVNEYFRDVRPYLWEGAWNMAWSNPLTGAGLGRFFIEIPDFRPREYFLMDKSADTTLHAHNDYLQVFAETGWIGLAFFLIFAVMMMRRLCLALRAGEGQAVSGTLLVVLSALLVKSFFDMDMQVVSSAFFFWIFAGLACAQEQSRTSTSKSFTHAPGWMLKITVFAVIAFCLFEYTAPFAAAQWLGKRASEAAAAGDWTTAQRGYAKAAELESGLVEIPFRLGFAYARTGDWDNALEAYETVRETAPAYSNVLFNMAVMHRQKGDYRSAMECLRAGFAVNPYSIPGHGIAREVFLLTGQTEKAKREDTAIALISSLKRGR